MPQDGAPPFPTTTALQIIQQELGDSPDRIFSQISTEPIAAASLGQVYRAVTADTGEEVAVKVQRPNMLPSIALDVYILRVLLGIVRNAAKINSDIRDIADEVGEGLYGELDYWREARQAQLFAREHAHLQYVRVPRVVE